MTTSALGPRRHGWRRPVSRSPTSRVARPANRGVRLPLVVWYASGQGPARRFDMSSEAERIEMYEIVPTEGTAEDVC